MLSAMTMTPLLDRDTLALVAREEPLSNVEWADYCIQAASVIVADTANHPDWLGLAADGTDLGAPVAAPRRAVMIAEQLAMRSYKNPDAIVAEGSLGPIGGDRYLDEFARTFELTTAERETLEAIARDSYPAAATGLVVIDIEVRPRPTWRDTIWLPDVDPRAKSWPIGSEAQAFAYTPPAV